MIESDSLCPDGTLQGGRVALTIKALRNKAERNKCSCLTALPSRRRSALAICQRQTTGESFKIPTSGCGKARRFCFARQAQSLRLTDDLKGMANRSVEIPRLPTTEADGFRGRVEGSKRRQMTARSDEAPLQLFGVPVFGGEQMRGAREVKQRECESREAD